MTQTRAKKNSGLVLLHENGKHVLANSANSLEFERFMSTVAHSPASVLLLDYDGTLAPFCRDRRQALPYAGITAVLQEIIANGRTRVVIITGRSAHEVVPLLGLHPHPEVWGCHGLERLWPDGNCEAPHLEERVLQALAEADRRLEHQGLQNLAECKTGAIAIHWRGLGEARAVEIRGLILENWSSIAQTTPMELLEFDGGIELRVPDRDKGDAVRTILGEIGREVPVAYLGDDLTDERAFFALGAMGLSVLVRPQWRKTAASLWIRPPEGVRDFLTKWLEACRDGQRRLPAEPSGLR